MKLFAKNFLGEKFKVLYDASDRNLIRKYKWKITPKGYAKHHVGKCQVYMHRIILGVTDKNIHVDHINHNPLDNRKENLRACTHRENMLNRKPRGKSKYLGVYTIVNHRKNDKVYRTIVAQIKIDGKNKYLGSFKTEEEAARAYDEKAKIVHGQFANLNFKL